MTLITADWLRERGFKYHDVERSGRHWLLWIGWAMPDCENKRLMSTDDFGIELTPRIIGPPNSWAMFFRADYCGRYSRFLFCRDVETAADLIRIVETLIQADWLECMTPYGYLARPATARRIREEDGRIDLMLARSQERAQGLDPDRATHV